MNVSDALCQRFTCRAFLDTPVSRETVERILTLAGRAPSSGNIQPWRVWALAGTQLEKLKLIVGAKIDAGQIFEGPPDYEIYPPDLQEPYLTRRFQNGERWYRSLNIAHDDYEARNKQITANFRFFGAPVGMIIAIERNMLQGQWADLGIFLQSLMLAATENGLDTAPLASWSFWSKTVHAFLDMPENYLIFCGVALGHADSSAPVNSVRQERAPLAEIATLRGF
ncbi:MAG: nitroreductase [Terricaulis sp.]